MNVNDLQDALELLSTPRIERLVNELEADPNVALTVGAWARCPMVLAGFNPASGHLASPERVFAATWDRVARTATPWWVPYPWRTRLARREDVQALLRTANVVLANRSTPRAKRTSRRRAGPIVVRRSGPGRGT